MASGPACGYRLFLWRLPARVSAISARQKSFLRSFGGAAGETRASAAAGVVSSRFRSAASHDVRAGDTECDQPLLANPGQSSRYRRCHLLRRHARLCRPRVGRAQRLAHARIHGDLGSGNGAAGSGYSVCSVHGGAGQRAYASSHWL